MIKIKNHLSIFEIEQKIKESQNIWIIKKLIVLSDGIRNNRTAKELAKNSGLAVSTVKNFISQYNRYGESVLENKHKNQRPHSYMTLEEEKDLLDYFRDKAEKGYLSTQKEIKEEYEKRIGKVVSPSTISRILKKHNWRKLVPRPKHPSSSKEEQENFKKKSSKKK